MILFIIMFFLSSPLKMEFTTKANKFQWFYFSLFAFSPLDKSDACLIYMEMGLRKGAPKMFLTHAMYQSWHASHKLLIIP